MKIKLVYLIGIVLLVASCSGNKVDKTLYGTWEPILQTDRTGVAWNASDLNFLLSVNGRCEEIQITKKEHGDLTNPDIAMEEPRCFGNRDELSFRDTYNTNTQYLLKMDASKDTLIGTATTKYTNSDDVVIKVKFLRL